MTIAINTPSGNVGRAAAERLLSAGESIRVLSRHPQKVADLVERGAALVGGSADDPQALDELLRGASAVLWVTPPAFRPGFLGWAREAARAGAGAARRHEVERAVVLSSMGAQNGPGTGPVGALLAVEDHFRDACPNVVALRPGFFMENLLREVEQLQGGETLRMPFPAEKPVPFVATRDIGEIAARWLADSTWSGQRILGVHGPRDVTYREVAQILGRALGREIDYEQVDLARARRGMLSAGMPEHAVDLLIELYDAARQGRLDPAEPRTAETTTPTSFEHFAREVLAPRIRGDRVG